MRRPEQRKSTRSRPKRSTARRSVQPARKARNVPRSPLPARLLITAIVLALGIGLLLLQRQRSTRVVSSVPPVLSPTIERNPALSISSTATLPVPTHTPTTAIVLTESTRISSSFEAHVLAEQMLILINRDREEAGLAPVSWDNLAADVALAHSADMNLYNYFSHRNLEGYGPDHRYSFAGGTDYPSENVYVFSHSRGGGPRSAADWEERIAEAQQSLMESPGHRATILSPGATHVGIGITYNETQGNLHIAQLFLNHYVDLDPVVRRVQPGETVIVSGQLLPGVSEPLINVAWEPFPEPMTREQLNATRSYRSSAEIVSVPPITIDSTGAFREHIVLNHENQPGLYHVRIWVNLDDNPIQAAQFIITAIPES